MPCWTSWIGGPSNRDKVGIGMEEEEEEKRCACEWDPRQVQSKFFPWASSWLTGGTKYTRGPEEDSIQLLSLGQQFVIFWLRTGHCRLLAHFSGRGLSPTDTCPCSTGAQTSEHLLQWCPIFSVVRGSVKSCGDWQQPFGGWWILRSRLVRLISIAWECRKRPRANSNYWH